MKKILLTLLTLGLIAGIVAYLMYNKPHDNISNAVVDISISSEQLFSEYEQNEAEANAKYLDKLVQVTGAVQSVLKNDKGMPQVTLNSGDELSGVICELDDLSEHSRMEFKEGEIVSFKGKCSGMLMDVVLVRCVEIEK